MIPGGKEVKVKTMGIMRVDKKSSFLYIRKELFYIDLFNNYSLIILNILASDVFNKYIPFSRLETSI